MNFMSLIRSIVCPDCDRCQEKDNQIQQLRRSLDECLKEIDTLVREKQYLKESLKSRDKVIDDLKTRLQTLETWPDEPESQVPEWLNNNGQSYKGVRQINEKGKTVTVKINPRDLYFPRDSLIRLVANNGWRNLEHDDKLMAIWGYVIYRIRYRFDAQENWQEPNITNDLKYGDCEDGTILFVTLARIAGVPADKVFNALGWFYSSDGKSRFGHSWPIAQMSDGKWYIFETTLDSMPKRPLRFLGSNYSADWGVHNWKYDGVIIPTQEWKGKKVKQI